MYNTFFFFAWKVLNIIICHYFLTFTEIQNQFPQKIILTKLTVMLQRNKNS